MARRTTFSPADLGYDPEARWRPRDRRGRTCGYTFRGLTCQRRGAHYCAPRADKVVTFFAELLLHTKGPLARHPFLLRPWQEHEIVRPLFGEVQWSPEHQMYARRYRIAYIVLGRKNGKSELAAGLLLYLLVGDDEESAEIYSAAKDTKQAGKVFEPALRMVQLSPRLSKVLQHFKNARRLAYGRTGSHYEVLTSDAKGELGHNPHGFNLDEVLSQPDGTMWEAMVTARGARVQELMFATTTETNEAASFGAGLIDEAERIIENPARAPHVFSFVRKLPRDEAGLEQLHRMYPGHPDLPVDCDPFNEANWKWPNPALDDFLSREALRRDALEARNEPAKENGFRQFRMNQRVSQVDRWMPMHLWDEACGELWLTPRQRWGQIAGRRAWAGFDLSARFDLTAWCLLLEPLRPDDPADMLWRFWVPESALPLLDTHSNGAASSWVRDGWLTTTEGDVLDYDRVYADIGEDADHFDIVAVDGDEWSSFPVIQEIGKRTSLDVDSGLVVYKSTYDRMSPGMVDLMSSVRQGLVEHHGNPVARWCFDNVQVRRAPYNPDVIRPDKPDRLSSARRIDAVPAAVMAFNARRRPTKASPVPQIRFIGGA